jgi:hypothetical protein
LNERFSLVLWKFLAFWSSRLLFLYKINHKFQHSFAYSYCFIILDQICSFQNEKKLVFIFTTWYIYNNCWHNIQIQFYF